MGSYSELQTLVINKFAPEWNVCRAGISESFNEGRWISFDLSIGEGFMGIIDKIAKVTDAIIGESFGVVDINIENANTTTPSVMFKVFDKEANNE